MKEERKSTRGAGVALYARVSSDKQVEEGAIESQVAALRERIEADGFVVDPTLCFIDDGVSGTTLVRPALERLRDLAATGAVARVYVLAPDRLARRHGHQLVLTEELEHGGRCRGGVSEPEAGSKPRGSTVTPGAGGHCRV